MKRTKNEYTSTRIWLQTLDKLREISELSDRTIVAVIDRLATAELKRLKKKDDRNPGN